MFNFRGAQDWEIIKVPQVTGEAGQTKLTLMNVPFRYSPSRNKMEEVELPDEALSSLIIEEAQQRVYCASRQGFIRTTFHCRGCDEQLDTSNWQKKEFHFTIAHNEFRPIEAILEAPAIQCSKCSQWNACELPKYPDADELIGAVIAAVEPRQVR